MGRNYNDLEFTHFVIDNSDGTIFGSARLNGSGRTLNFLINSGVNVRQQNGDYWLDLEPDVAELVIARATGAYGQVPTYRTGRLLF